MLSVGPDICAHFETSSSHEWLEANGVGGYASGTISGANTRRYHGLLVAATRPPLGRVVMLSKLEEILVIDGRSFELSSNQYPGNIHPEGYQYLVKFQLDPFPVWTYDVDGLMIKKSIFMVHGENTTVCHWNIVNDDRRSLSLELRPLLAFRDHHHLRHEDDGFATECTSGGDKVSIRPYPEMPTLHFTHNAIGIEHQGHWYRDFEYALEHERGFDYHEDLFQPFSLTFDLSSPANVIASTELHVVADAVKLQKAEMKRRAALVAGAKAKDEVSTQLVLAADQFIVKRGTGKTVIAGYHWFSDWGRDTMISLPGLTLSTNRPEIAKSIITEFSKHISEGMLPNRFPDAGETPEYNTVDATLWYFEAIRAYVEKTGDSGFVRTELYNKLSNIIDWHVLGTRYGIKVDSDGLLNAGGPGVQLTWMDAKVGNWVVTPRTGKPVEIQALWYNALCIMSNFAKAFDDKMSQKAFKAMAAKVKASFRSQFWNNDAACLYDVVNGNERDASIRPNQVFAVSLPFSMLDASAARKVVAKIEAELLTPFGLRSLSPNDPRYAPIYIGSPLERDGSYHQGTVWGWLIGPFIDAYRRTHSKDAKAESHINEILAGFRAHLSETMIGQISEIFDAYKPHLPRGCAAQAWSVAEVLRVNHTDP